MVHLLGQTATITETNNNIFSFICMTIIRSMFTLKTIALKNGGAARWLHYGRASAEATKKFVMDAKHVQSAVIKLGQHGEECHIARVGFGSPSLWLKETQVIEQIKDAVLESRNNFVQTSLYPFSQSSNSDEAVALAEAVAINELLTDDGIAREALVISAIIDENVLHPAVGGTLLNNFSII